MASLLTKLPFLGPQRQGAYVDNPSILSSESRDLAFYQHYDDQGIPKRLTPELAKEDAKDLKASRLRATLWGLLGPVSLGWRAINQNPVKHATDRKDFLNEERSYAGAISHERGIKQAQVVAGLLPSAAWIVWLGTAALRQEPFKNVHLARLFSASIIPITVAAQFLGIALLDHPEDEARNMLAKQRHLPQSKQV